MEPGGQTWNLDDTMSRGQDSVRLEYRVWDT